MKMFKQVKLLPAEAQLAHISLNKLSTLQDLIPCQENRLRYGKSPCRLSYIKNELHLSASPCTRSLILPRVNPLLESLKVKQAEERAALRFRSKKKQELLRTGIQNPKEIEQNILIEEYEQQKLAEKRKRDKNVLKDPAKMSVNIVDLLAQQSDIEEYGDVDQLEKDLPGVEIDFRFIEKPMNELKIDARQLRIARARKNLQKKHFVEDTRPVIPIPRRASPTRIQSAAASQKIVGFVVPQTPVAAEAEIEQRPLAKAESVTEQPQQSNRTSNASGSSRLS